VVVDGLRPRVVRSELAEKRVAAVCGAGGADITPKHFQIRLDHFDPPTVAYLDEDADEYANRLPTFSLNKGDAEKIHIIAHAEHADVEWYVDLLLIVNGRREVLPIRSQRNGGNFRTCGISEIPSVTWAGNGWTKLDWGDMGA